jgi:uncharacterized membrane protein
MFYLDDPALLKRMLRVYLAGTMAFVLFFVLGIPRPWKQPCPTPSDWLTLVFIIIYCVLCLDLIRIDRPCGKNIAPP